MPFASLTGPPSSKRIDEFSAYTGASPPSITVSRMAAMHRGTLLAEVGMRDDGVSLLIFGHRDAE
jgi:hypothetical protein